VNARLLALSGAAGRFDTGFAFRNPNAVLQIANHADFALGPGDSFTIELFIKPDAAAGEATILAKHADPANPALPGWTLTLGELAPPRSEAFWTRSGCRARRAAPSIPCSESRTISTAGGWTCSGHGLSRRRTAFRPS